MNQSVVTEFILLGINNRPELQLFLFTVFLMFYLFCFLGNLSIVFVVIFDYHLHNPMYFFLGNLSFLDFFYSSTTVPKMLAGLVVEEKRISFQGCITQLHMFHFLGSTEAMFLTIMSYDRYVAICNPLRYHVLMAKTICIQLSAVCWTTGFIYSLTHTILTSRLPFCLMNKLTHFYCDIKPLLKLACTDTHLNERLVSIVTGSVAVFTFMLIIMSYTFISRHLLNIQSTHSRHKAISTCTSHMTVVLLYYGTGFCTYLRPATKDSLEQDRITGVLFTVITPALNPLIYTLRNKDVKKALTKMLFGNLWPQLHMGGRFV
ncbi:olfactory receptor 12D3-like [Xenopus laevis]|uniref:Olfactory receptor n=1 Tax=Xenopus laevis TaxID=8355 RepID=A0A8J1LM37_XENLA|nr:olfactory receptor 12D3-like [Xenopus laevis]